LALTVPGSAAVPRNGFAVSPPWCRCAGHHHHQPATWWRAAGGAPLCWRD